jgi:hypothetical protein
METITEIQFNNLISSEDPDSEIQRLPEHIRNDIESLRDCTESGKAHLLLTHPLGQDKYFLEYVAVDELCDEELAETLLRAKEDRGHLVAV